MKRAGRTNPRKRRATEGVALLAALDAAFSQEEIRSVLAGSLLALDEAGRLRLCERLGPDTGATLRQVLGARGPRPHGRAPTPGKGRIREEWDQLWSEWDDCVAEAGHEDGKYIFQEHHWEQPCLDCGSLCADLEKISTRMRKLIPRVVQDDLDSDLSFAEALADTATDVGAGLPDWMDGGEGCDFGPEVTGCLLDWEWRTSRRTGVGAFDFVSRIRKLECSLTKAGLDGDAIAEFVVGLDEADQRAVLAGLLRARAKEPWAEVLDAPRSAWFRLLQQLARRWDPALFTQTCRANVAKDWNLALPLLTQLLRRRAFPEALALVEEAVRALLHLAPGESWDPRDELLVRHREIRYSLRNGGAQGRLFEAWRKAALSLGQTELAGALDIQTVTARQGEDWDAVLATFQRAEKTAGRAICDRLFAQWQTEAAEESAGVAADDDSDGLELGWLRGLADAARAGDAGPNFHRAVREWLAAVARAPGAIERARYSLATLTLDVDLGDRLKQTCPTLHRLLSQERRGTPTLERSRRQLVKRLRGAELYTDVIDFWKRNAVALIPDPADGHKACYDLHAEWLTAIRELDPDAYAGIVRRWAVMHQRRRNLWQALARRGLPLA